jgi:hypothetical protein
MMLCQCLGSAKWIAPTSSRVITMVPKHIPRNKHQNIGFGKSSCIAIEGIAVSKSPSHQHPVVGWEA